MRYLIFAVSWLMLGTVAAQEHSVGARLGFLGIGLEYAYRFSDRLAFRGGINGSGYTFDETESGIDYEFDLDFDSWSAGVDFYPAAGAFRVSGGLLSNDSALTAASLPSGSFSIGDNTYPASAVGILRGSIGFDGTAPFVGLGWEWLRGKRVGAALDLGIVRQGAPGVSLRADGPIASDPGFAADLAAEQAELQDAFDDLDLYPFASVGIVFRF